MTDGATSPHDLPRPRFARMYARLADGLEARGLGLLRDELLAGVRGHVVEVGAGNGLNFARYPDTVTGVEAIEPEPHLRALAERAAVDAPVPVAVRPGTASALPVADGAADVVVLCLVLCSVDDVPGALAEVRRVLRPGGEVRFLEHERASTAGLRTVQRVADATLWPRLAGGCHTTRRPTAALEAAGLQLGPLRRLRFPDTRVPVPAAPHVLGVATRPA